MQSHVFLDDGGPATRYETFGVLRTVGTFSAWGSGEILKKLADHEFGSTKPCPLRAERHTHEEKHLTTIERPQ